ncbi:uncharacterized protein BT62DRAFT_976702 [Guyanagaster necrorhizus]|uniref:Uncharacterized protein n=1 Tax=Guyanagaster necrorhizus TaxID=856835 RepID=A0A9P8ALG7_9AGAR|nr:uncharacterized protein BT62DRAFT_976702 [Guyanagaster necrorhizus MCA 3950]KAG7439626.1 hypothetical protein BT62DRAFT_976702 [Guyanagaster necrorhizus MCA 3950]
MSPPPSPYDSPTLPAMEPAPELKENGDLSLIRAHRGNVPTLPQTKYCPICPAKFTRTTHLYRHLRSHSNERAHHCERCGAEFTRSDLLTRHKRTCGDPFITRRSRRKSCQACADSKIKCNLEKPCSKCVSRGRKCVYINDPADSRDKKKNVKKRRPKKPVQTKELPAESSSEYLSSPTFSSDSLPSPHNSEISPTVHSLAADSGPFSSSTPLASSSLSDAFDAVTIIDGDDELQLHDPLGKIFPNSVLDNLLEKYSFSSPGTTQPPQDRDLSWFAANGTPGLSGDYFSFMPISLSPDSTPPDYESFMRNPSPTYTASQDSLGTSLPLDTEKQQYLYLFFSAFCTQIPLVHPGSWTIEDKPPVLARAMQACGALFLKTRRAVNFITETLSSTRDALIHEFTKVPCSPKEQDFLILAVVLLQTIGLFHQRSDFRVSSNVYHGMLVMMIRRTEAIARSRSWTASDLNDPFVLEQTWRDWALHETVKRALLLSYLHDCCHSVFFSMRPSFQTAEFDMNLPCDEAIWKAETAAEWIDLLQKPSPYGLGSARLYGVGMQQALAHLGEMRLPTSLTPLNPFSQFILIHTILRNIYYSYSVCDSDSASSTSPEPVGNEDRRGSQFAAQYTLTNWLRMWMSCPEAVKPEDGDELDDDEPPFAQNALPFYWLAQISLLAIQEGGSAWTEGAVESRFHVMKEWLDRIRFFLRKDKEIPPHLWEELMVIRRQVSQVEMTALEDHPDGLLSFFPEH